jgi:TP901 family phage tail tape measure protein
MANMEVSVLMSLVDKIRGPLNKVSAGFRNFGNSVKQSKTRMQKARAAMAEVGNQSIKTGKNLTRKLTLPLVGLGIAAAKFAMDFEEGMQNVATLIPGNVKRVEQLGQGVRKLAKDTGTSTGELTEGLYQVVSAFGDSADTMDQLAAANKAAIAGNASVVDSINLLSAVTKGYGDTSAEAQQKASDLAFETVRMGQTTFPELAASIGKVIPTASALGVEQEELFAGFATLTGVTGGTAEVATQLRGAMAALMKPTTDMQNAVRTLGYESAEQLIKTEGLVGGFRSLVGTTDGSTESMGKLFGRVEALNGVLALTGEQADVFDEKFGEMRDSAGATEKAFAEQEKTTKMTWKKMIANIKDLAISLGQVLLPFINKVIGAVTKLTEWFSEMSGPLQAIIIGIGAIAALAGPVLTLIGVFAKLKAFMAAMSFNPVVLGIVGVVAAATVLFALFKKNKKNVEEMNESIANVAGLKERSKSNKELLSALRQTEFGSDSYKKKLDELVMLNPELANQNLQVAESFEEVEDAVNGVNRALDAKAQKEAMDTYKAGLNTVKDLAEEYAIQALMLERMNKGTTEYREQLVKVNALQQELEDQTSAVRRAAEQTDIYSAGEIERSIQREIRSGTGGVASMIGGDRGAGMADTIQQFTGVSENMQEVSNQNIEAANKMLEAAGMETQIGGLLNIHITSDGGSASATGGITGGNVKTAISARGTGNGGR